MKLDGSTVLDAITQMQVSDSQTIANAVNERVRAVSEVTLAPAITSSEVDFSPIYEALRKDKAEVLDEMRRLAVTSDGSPMLSALKATQLDLGLVHEAIGRIHRALDFAPILEAVRMVSAPDAQVLATAVHEKMCMAPLRQAADLDPLIDAINGAEVDFTPVITTDC